MIKIDVKCDICGKEKQIGYRKYLNNFNKYQIYSCSNKCSMFKNTRTNLEKYGVEHQCHIDTIIDKIINTKIEKGLINNRYNYMDFNNYRRVVNNFTNRNKKILIKLWNGLDYYDNEYIKHNFMLGFNHPSYPTIDHKISVMFAFNNKLSALEISHIENLCITKRSNNSAKNYLCESEFKKIVRDTLTI